MKPYLQQKLVLDLFINTCISLSSTENFEQIYNIVFFNLIDNGFKYYCIDNIVYIDINNKVFSCKNIKNLPTINNVHSSVNEHLGCEMMPNKEKNKNNFSFNTKNIEEFENIWLNLTKSVKTENKNISTKLNKEDIKTQKIDTKKTYKKPDIKEPSISSYYEDILSDIEKELKNKKQTPDIETRIDNITKDIENKDTKETNSQSAEKTNIQDDFSSDLVDIFTDTIFDSEPKEKENIYIHQTDLIMDLYDISYNKKEMDFLKEKRSIYEDKDVNEKESIEKDNIKIIVAPLDMETSEINNFLQSLAIGIFDGNIAVECSLNKNKNSFLLNVGKYDFTIRGRNLNGEFDSLLYPSKNKSEISKTHRRPEKITNIGHNVIYKYGLIFHILPLSNKNNESGSVNSVVCIQDTYKQKNIIKTNNKDEQTIKIPYLGNVYKINTYWDNNILRTDVNKL